MALSNFPLRRRIPVVQPRGSSAGKRSVARRLALRLKVARQTAAAAVDARPFLLAVPVLVLLLPVVLLLLLRFALGRLPA